MKVSVMMPAYNAERFIAEALDSILVQDYPDIEIVVCDDASKDNTVEIIKEYVDKYPGKIRAIFNEQNIGITENCNLALSNCDGHFVSLFAGDDIMLPGKIRQQVELMKNDDSIALCYHPVEVFDSDSDLTMYITNQTTREDINSFDDMLTKGGIPGGCSIMVRRDAIPFGGYDSRLSTVSDWLFFLEISLAGRVVKVNKTLGRYRKHAQGASKNTYELLEESLSAIDLLLLKHPELSAKRNLLDKAKARYLAGEAFRQLSIDPVIAVSVAKRTVDFDVSIKYKVLFAVALGCKYIPGISAAVDMVSRRMKFFIKKMVG